MKSALGLRLATRGLIKQDDKLLFVSHDGEHWTLPGGRPESGETLKDCLEREVYEETGLSVQTQELSYVLECFDECDSLYKLLFYFSVTVLDGVLSDSWRDIGNHVKYRQYFSREEIQKNPRILPRFLAGSVDPKQTYQGFVTMRGFEMVEPKTKLLV